MMTGGVSESFYLVGEVLVNMKIRLAVMIGGIAFGAVFASIKASTQAWLYHFDGDGRQVKQRANLDSEGSPWHGGYRDESASSASPLKDQFEGGSWGYTGAVGPDHWASLSVDYALCGNTTSQSPVDIPQGALLSSKFPDLRWKDDGLQIQSNSSRSQILLSGGSHTIHGSDRYVVKRLEIHSPSEHWVNGLMFPLEIQIVQESTRGKAIIFAVFVEIGKEHPEMRKILDQFSRGKEISDFVNRIELTNFLPKDREHYSYQGSYTAPPCLEGVSWIVFSKTIEMSEAQVSALRSIYGHNARPVQPLGHRLMKAASK
jgi:carbonic anhydrase